MMRACLAVWTEGLLVLPVVLAVFRGCGGGTPWPWLVWLAAAGAAGAGLVRLGLRRTGSVLAAALVAGGVTWVLAGAGWGSGSGGAWLALFAASRAWWPVSDVAVMSLGAV
ncbi:hypothetical protein, partial [Alicyclobacillus cellulosilyticus]|uniref:hypothetical protein n=1 Tax=Alicyclobacillus cellulosilyticus TaxID=1003997 RepID=UPI001E551263